LISFKIDFQRCEWWGWFLLVDKLDLGLIGSNCYFNLLIYSILMMKITHSDACHHSHFPPLEVALFEVKFQSKTQRKMKTQKRFSIPNYLVVLFAVGLLFSCEQLAPEEAPIQVAEEFVDMDGIALEPDEDPIGARLVYSSDCESDCIEPGSGNYFAIRDSKSKSSGINTKKVSYKAYNTEDRFVVKARYEITTGPSQAKASITIQINGKKKEFKSVPSGYTATFSIPLDKGWDKCDLVTFSIIQKGLGTTISFSEDYGLIPVCEIGDTFTDPRDGQVYKIVRIGDQIWMAENLNFDLLGSECFNDDPGNCEKNGRLYRWSYVRKGPCPNGWHMPDIFEWETLFNFLGGNEIAGGKMKSISGWPEPNIGATNESGFNGLPSFPGEIDGWGIWLSSSSRLEGDIDPVTYWKSINLFSDKIGVVVNEYDAFGQDQLASCRCIKD
jgi:uncharacterized protein (TIGR02145 family)